jgi:hypothetical protein
MQVNPVKSYPTYNASTVVDTEAASVGRKWNLPPHKKWIFFSARYFVAASERSGISSIPNRAWSRRDPQNLECESHLWGVFLFLVLIVAHIDRTTYSGSTPVQSITIIVLNELCSEAMYCMLLHQVAS